MTLGDEMRDAMSGWMEDEREGRKGEKGDRAMGEEREEGQGGEVGKVVLAGDVTNAGSISP